MRASAKLTSIEPRQLASGEFSDVCTDCGATLNGATAQDVLGATCGCQARHTVEFLAELTCMMCGRAVGTVTVPRRDARILIPQALHCQKCGGRPVVGDVFGVSRYPDLRPIQSKRGRRPKQLRLEHLEGVA
jgi:DNA-directed RNA polymerase subunit RPC12/RpoP